MGLLSVVVRHIVPWPSTVARYQVQFSSSSTAIPTRSNAIAAAPTVTNNIVAPYILWNGTDFATYGVNGFVTATYDTTNLLAISSTLNANVAGGTVSSISAVNALKTTNALTLNADLRIASGGLIISGKFSIAGPGGLSFVDDSNNDVEAIIAPTSTTTISSAITRAAGITLAGAGSLTLASTYNAFTGQITLAQGTLIVAGGDDRVLGNSSNGILLDGGTFNFSGTNLSL